MQKNALFGWAFFIVIAVVGAIFFTNAKKKSDAQAQLDSYKYFASLMAEDQSQTVPNPNGGRRSIPGS